MWFSKSTHIESKTKNIGEDEMVEGFEKVNSINSAPVEATSMTPCSKLPNGFFKISF